MTPRYRLNLTQATQGLLEYIAFLKNISTGQFISDLIEGKALDRTILVEQLKQENKKLSDELKKLKEEKKEKQINLKIFV